MSNTKMDTQAKIDLLRTAPAAMKSSLELCLDDAQAWIGGGRIVNANVRIEKAAQYAWGFWRPANW